MLFIVMFEKENNIVVAKFVDGEIIQNLKNLMDEAKIESAIIINGVGMLENSLIGYFNGRDYIKERITKPAELVSLQGNIGKNGNDYIVHAHVALANEEHILKGGHLLEGDVKVVNEIVLYALKKIKIGRIKRGRLMEMEITT